MDHAARRARVRTAVGDRASALLVTNAIDIRYLTGFTGSNAQLLLGDHPILFTDGRYKTQVGEQVSGMEVVIYEQNTSWVTPVAAAMSDGASLAYDPAQLSVSAARELSACVGDVREVFGVVAGVRAIKDSEELSLIERAQRVAEFAVTSVMDSWSVGTEKQLALDLEWAVRTSGADGLSFDVIVASGAHSALPHARPRDVEIGSGPILIDIGARIDGYCSDMTRVWLRDAPEEMLRAHEAVERALEAGCRVVADGVDSSEVDRAAREVLKSEGLEELFVHSAGHAIGLEAHELPKLANANNSTLRAGMVITIEPGVYVPGVGGVRIEDLIVVTQTGFQNLTRLPRVCG